MNRLLLIAILVAALCPRSSSTTSPARSRGIVTGHDGKLYAVVHLEATMEEASNMGGEHDTFAIDEPARSTPRLAHAGGHGQWYGLDGWLGQRPVSDYFVAELQMHPRRAYTYDHADGGWGTTTLPPFDAEVVRLMLMRDLDTARAELPRVALHQVPFDAFGPSDQLGGALGR